MTTYEVIVRYLGTNGTLNHDYITVVAVSEDVACTIAADIFTNEPPVEYEYYEVIVAREVGDE